MHSSHLLHHSVDILAIAIVSFAIKKYSYGSFDYAQLLKQDFDSDLSKRANLQDAFKALFSNNKLLNLRIETLSDQIEDYV